MNVSAGCACAVIILPLRIGERVWERKLRRDRREGKKRNREKEKRWGEEGGDRRLECEEDAKAVRRRKGKRRVNVPRSSSGLGVWSSVAGVLGMKVVVVDGVEGGILVLKEESTGWVEILPWLVGIPHEGDLLMSGDDGGL